MSEQVGVNDGIAESRIQLESSWKARVGSWLLRPEMLGLAAFLRARKVAGVRVYPPGSQIFAAFEATPFEQVKVVILGQDPYHGYGQAHGLCFRCDRVLQCLLLVEHL